MAVIKNLLTGELVFLQSQHAFGRNKLTNNTALEEQDVSKSHATINWNDGGWYLHDHSRNGTLIGKDYVHQTSLVISKGEVIQFGKGENTRWQVLDLSPPVSYLKCLDTPKYCLPDQTESDWNTEIPDISIFYGSNGNWQLETKEHTYLLENGTTIDLNDEKWCYVENEAINDTIDNHQLVRKAYFQFELTPDEERIFLMLYINELKYDIGERTFNHLLLALARIRLEDAEDAVAYEEQGWVSMDKLAKMISKEIMKDVDQYYLNVQIHRLRKQLINLKPFGYLLSGIIERRLGEIRFAHHYFQILKENKVIGEVIGKE